MAKTESWASSAATRASMKGNRSRDTTPELALRRILHARGLRFFVNRRPVATLRRTADLIFPRLRLAVFVDGCFWHGCPQHHTVAKLHADYWAEKVNKNRQRDAETNEVLRSLGWTVLRIWEHVPVDEAATLIEAALGDLGTHGEANNEHRQ